MSLNKRERGFIDGIDSVLADIASLTPRNPADLSAKLANLRIAVDAARAAHRAVIAWRGGESEFVDEFLAEAKSISSGESLISPSERAVIYVADLELALGIDAPVPHKLGGNDD